VVCLFSPFHGREQADRDDVHEALRRIADPTEISGSGELESMRGPAAVELEARINVARRALGLESWSR
jgi:hypothetical protein